MARLLEDLAVFSDQLAGLMQDAAASGALTPSQEATDGAAYGPRMRGAMAILRRAEGWLETVDHETGARVRLPGFEGGPALEGLLDGTLPVHDPGWSHQGEHLLARNVSDRTAIQGRKDRGSLTAMEPIAIRVNHGPCNRPMAMMAHSARKERAL